MRTIENTNIRQTLEGYLLNPLQIAARDITFCPAPILHFCGVYTNSDDVSGHSHRAISMKCRS